MEKTNEQIWAKLEEINKMVAQCCKNQLKISEAGKINDKVRNLMKWEPRRDKLMQFEPTWGEFVTCDENEYGRKWIMIWGGESDSGHFTNEIYGYYETLGSCGSGCCCTMTGNTFRPSTDAEKKQLLDKLSEDGKVWNPILMRIEDKKWEPKDGEFIVAKDGTISILGKKEPKGYFNVLCRLYKNGRLDSDPYGIYTPDFITRKATGSERQLLLDALKKAGKTWNAELKRAEDVPVGFKDGDFLAGSSTDGRLTLLFILKDNGKSTMRTHANIYSDGYCFSATTDTIYNTWLQRRMTESERVTLLSALEKAGKAWNAEKKCVEDIKPEVEGFKDGCYVTLDEEWVSLYRGVSAVKNAISDYCGTHINHGDFTDLMPATHRCYNSIRPSTQSEISRFNALLSHAKKRAEDAPTKVVELTMEQVCEKLGMNVKIIKK